MSYCTSKAITSYIPTPEAEGKVDFRAGLISKLHGTANSQTPHTLLLVFDIN